MGWTKQTTMELKTLYALKSKERTGLAKGFIRTNLYNENKQSVGSYPPLQKQPHGNSKTIMHNCFKYKLVFIKSLDEII